MASTHNSNRPILVPASMLARLIHINEDLLVEILKRLPTKTLIRFLCACKSWKTLISTPLFIRLHNSFPPSPTPLKLKPYLQLAYDSYHLFRPRDSLGKHIIKRKLHFPFRIPQSAKGLNFTFIDVIRGVICLSYSSDSPYDSFILWNPVFHKYVTLPRLPKTYDFYRCAIGFGYDISKKDFKVVEIQNPNYQSTYELYSAKEGEWRVAIDDKLKSCEFVHSMKGIGCFVNGNIHWLVEYSHADISLLMFDCEREEFTMMELPREMFPRSILPLEEKILEFINGMLCVVMNSHLYYEGQRGEHVELWVMEEYGVATSWKKLYRFRYCYASKLNQIDVLEPSFEELVPYGLEEWSKCSNYNQTFEKIVSRLVYEESMFLMDDPKSQSYTKKEKIFPLASKPIQGI